MTAALLAWLVLGVGVVAYALTGGADFGGGIWHLFARGKDRERDQTAVAHAIAPIWEANHVWVIFVIVVLFTVFPRAFAIVSIALHVPISLALVGIVLRGSAFVFQSYDLGGESLRRRFFRALFGGASLVTPFFLGTILGALSTGDIRAEGSRVTSGFAAGYTTAFAAATGVFAVVLFALLAAVYLTVVAESDVAERFRKRALGAELVAGAVAFLVLALARSDAKILYARLSGSAWTWPIQTATALAALATLAFLAVRRYRLARAAVACQVTLVLVGWGAAMGPYMVVPDVTVEGAAVGFAASAVLPVLVAGFALLLPALFYLYRVFRAIKA